jgi:pimeloyl-ACP methyl ester carboxylesterase
VAVRTSTATPTNLTINTANVKPHHTKPALMMLAAGRPDRAVGWVLVCRELRLLVAEIGRVHHRVNTSYSQVAAAVLIDSPLLTGGNRAEVVRDLVAGLRGRDPDSALRDYFASFFGRYDDAATKSWILDQARLTEPHVTSSIWEEYLVSWDDESALRACRVPVLCIDAGTPNADLTRVVELCPGLMIARTIGSGHFSPLVVSEQVNAVLERFLRVAVSG